MDFSNILSFILAIIIILLIVVIIILVRREHFSINDIFDTVKEKLGWTEKEMGENKIEEEKIDEIIEAQREVTDALKEDRDKYKVDAEKLTDVQKKYDDLKKEVESKEGDTYKEKYDKEHKAFEDYKAGIEADRVKANKMQAYKGLLKKAGVSDKRIDSILKVTAIDDVELDEEGNLKDSDKIIEHIKSEWSEFIVKETRRGAGTENPPANSGGNKLTKADIYKKDERGRYIMSTAERQKALMENAGE